MIVMVTGDRGYIGSALVPKLLSRKYEVIGLDTNFFDRSTERIVNVSYRKIDKDIRKVSPKDLVGVDAIIHLAALSNDPMGEINPKLTEEINHKASIRLARLAKKGGVKKFIFSSSCSIYGIAESGVVDERSKVNPLTAYAVSKIKTERSLRKLSDDSFLVFLLRNSTVFGFSPVFRNDLVVNNLVTTSLAFNEIRIASDGTPWRPLIDVRDLSDIFIHFLETRKKRLSGEIINIGFDKSNFQVKDLVNNIKKALPRCKVVYTGEHGSDSRSYRVDFKKFKKEFPDLKQKWGLSRSIKDMITNLGKMNYTKSDFESGKNARLTILKELLQSKKVDKRLFWRS